MARNEIKTNTQIDVGEIAKKVNNVLGSEKRAAPGEKGNKSAEFRRDLTELSERRLNRTGKVNIIEDDMVNWLRSFGLNVIEYYK